MKLSSNNSPFQISIPNGWQLLKDFHGIPFMIIGPQSESRRPTLLVIPTGIGGVHFDAKDSKQSEEEFKKSRLDWLSRRSGEAISFYPYEYLRWNGISEAHLLSYTYRLNNQSLTERSYYLICGQKLFQIKSIFLVTQESTFGAELNNIVRSFRCE